MSPRTSPSAEINREMVRRFLQWLVAQQYAVHTQKKYCSVCNKFCAHLANKPLSDVLPIDIANFLTASLPPAHYDGLINDYLSALRCFFEFLYLGGVVDTVAPKQIRLRPRIKKIPPTLTQSQVKRLISAAQSSRDRAMIELLYATGCRSRELVRIRVEDIDFVRRKLRVASKRKERVVYFGSPAATAIRQYLGKRRHGYLFQDCLCEQRGFLQSDRGRFVGNYNEYEGAQCNRVRVHLGRVPWSVVKATFDKYLMKLNLRRPKPDRPLHVGTVNRIVYLAATRARLGKVTARMLRHSFATHLVERGADLLAVQQLLGHGYLSSTQVYARISNKVVAKTFRHHHPRGA